MTWIKYLLVGSAVLLVLGCGKRPKATTSESSPAQASSHERDLAVARLDQLGMKASPCGADGVSVQVLAEHLYADGALKPNIYDALQRPKNLEELSFQSAPISNRGLAQLNDFTKLKKLNLQGALVSDAGMANLQKMTRLESINLINVPISDRGLAALGRVANLLDLQLGSTSDTKQKITNTGLVLLQLGKLEQLRLSGTLITDAGLVQLRGSTNLAALWLDDCAITDQGLESLRGLQKLRTLSLGRARITSQGLANLAGLKDLWFLNFKYCQGIADDALPSLEGLTSLQHLELAGTSVTKEAAARLAKKLPRCKIEGNGWAIEASK